MGAKIRNQNYNDHVEQAGKNKKNETKLHSNQGEFAWVGEGVFYPGPQICLSKMGEKEKLLSYPQSLSISFCSLCC